MTSWISPPPRKLGKTAGKDLQAKSNLSQSVGLEESQRQAQLIEAAQELATFGERETTTGDRGLHYQPHSLKPVGECSAEGSPSGCQPVRASRS